jgi:DNA (cytosine-5)-methyltransferase 1
MENKKLKVLNLYAGIGGNRKLWTGDIEVTAIENVPEIAKIYQDFFPNDKVIVTDAHQYLLEHYKEFDFIWSSPPCPSHSRLRKCFNFADDPIRKRKEMYPDMKLYQEIIFLQHHFKGKWVVENVYPYYEPLIPAFLVQRHLFWANFLISDKKVLGQDNIQFGKIKEYEKIQGFNLDKYKGISKRTLLRNCVRPEIGLHIFKMAFKSKQEVLI